MSCLMVVRILLLKSNLGDETMTLFERSLAIFVKHEGVYGLVLEVGV
jgi:hypothetical protein